MTRKPDVILLPSFRGPGGRATGAFPHSLFSLSQARVRRAAGGKGEPGLSFPPPPPPPFARPGPGGRGNPPRQPIEKSRVFLCGTGGSDFIAKRLKCHAPGPRFLRKIAGNT